MTAHPLTNAVEAILLAAGRPLTVSQIAELFDEFERPGADDVRVALKELAGRYANHGIEVVEVASGWRVQVRPQHSDVVSRLWQERPTRYSRALLETLALIAYRQPITRSEIEEIRGVTVSSTIMRTLHERNWVRVVGHREVPGRPELLGTTREFLDYFSLRNLDDLPTLAEVRDLDDPKLQLELPGEAAAVEPAVDDDAALAILGEGSSVETADVRDDDAAEEAVDDYGSESGAVSAASASTLVAAPPQTPES